MNNYLNVLKKYTVFKGRARRKEYWGFALVNIVILFILGIFDTPILVSGQASFGILGGIYSLLVFLPSLAVTVRRLHDSGKSGWWILMSLIPLVGGVILLILLVLDSQNGQNKYGPSPILNKTSDPDKEPDFNDELDLDKAFNFDDELDFDKEFDLDKEFNFDNEFDLNEEHNFDEEFDLDETLDPDPESKPRKKHVVDKRSRFYKEPNPVKNTESDKTKLTRKRSKSSVITKVGK